MSASVIRWRANGAGFSGIGCVGHVSSPARSERGAARSSIGKSGAPVARSNRKTKPDLVICATASTRRPSRVTRDEVGHRRADRGPRRRDARSGNARAAARSRRRARGASWRTGSAPAARRHRSPGEAEPVGTNDDAAPLVHCHARPGVRAPRRARSVAGQVSAPSCPGCGIVWKIQRSCPVRTSYARTCPGAAPGPLAHARALDDQVLVDHAGARGHELRTRHVAAESFAELHPAAATERRHRSARRGVRRD